jgi:beta-lactamase regulating signal transducer with metallopeptidase domain
MERAVVEYIANALWQVPLLAGGAWLFLWAVRPCPRVQHGVWLAVLALAAVLPMHGMGSGMGSTNTFAVQKQPVGMSLADGPVSDTALDPQQQFAASGGLTRPVVRKTTEVSDWFVITPRVHSVYLAASAVEWLVRAYVAAVLFGVFRIVRAWRAARHLVESSREVAPCQREMAHLERYGERLGVRLPQLRESSEVASPMIVGLVAPVMLLPEGFWRHTEDEVKAALCHELAHVKRRDYLVNLVCQVVALPVGWHPVTYGVQRRIRRTREMVCDAMAAQEMQSEIGYARCLLAMARSMLGGGMVEQAEGLGLFGNNILEERVMRLMETKTAVSVRARIARAASGATMMIAATAMAAMFHVVPTMAQQNTEAAMPAVPSMPSPPAPPVVSVAEPAPAVQPDPAPQAAPAPVAPAPPSAPAAISLLDDDRHPGQEEITIRRENGKTFAIVNGVRRELTPEERRRLNKEIADAQRQVAEATAKINSPEFKKQIADAQKEAREATERINSPEFKKQIEDAQKEAVEASARINSPEFKKQMEDARKDAIEAAARVNSPEFKRQIEDAQRQAREATERINSPEFKKQIEDAKKEALEASARINSPEFKKQIEDAARQSSEARDYVNSPEFKQQMADVQKQLQGGQVEMQRQMKEAMEKLKEAQDQLREETSH